MSFALLSHGESVGHSALDRYDAEQRVASGTFTPERAWGRVQKVYRRARAELAQMRYAPARPGRGEREAVVEWAAALREELGFVLLDAAGLPIASTYLGVEEGPDGALELHVGLARPEEWLDRYGSPYRPNEGDPLDAIERAT